MGIKTGFKRNYYWKKGEKGIKPIAKMSPFRKAGSCWGCRLYCSLSPIQYLEGSVIHVCAYCEQALGGMATMIITKKPSLSIIHKLLILQKRLRNIKRLKESKREKELASIRRAYDNVKDKIS